MRHGTNKRPRSTQQSRTGGGGGRGPGAGAGWVAPKSESCELDANSLKSAKRDGGVEGRSFGRWRGLDPESVICPTRRVLAGLGAAKSFAPPVEFWPQKARVGALGWA